MQLVFATNNPNKIKEIQALVPAHIKLLSLADILCIEDIPETTGTIEGNAKQKADHIKNHYGYDCFADDTGLEVEALNGEPGVNTAYYAGPQRDANDNMDKLLNNLKDNPNRNAQFKTVIALHLNGNYHEFTGICKGEITKGKQGNKGFGYDPVFRPLGYEQTFAQINLNLKTQIGHRGKAIKQLFDFLKNT
ncbi:non-canonical purine NTP diphosphatase [Winogradskyella sp. KYW1333]|uniref:non-canonical purine NTP diphosphatase n=1 Tax=Winogradskyella sp. KYW1333 TaxID=2282123 RepID=UPI000DF23F0A|nr:non-canonical purine NTP diphosphatase [Winogradskyella sp. KYW1333]RCT54744.1 non-canonical purine NTP diphosphatase [Winogradskyella sp. KYW1333]